MLDCGGAPMSSEMNAGGGQTETVEQKVDKLSASVDKRFDTLSASVDKRFDDVAAALVEQRNYTEFAFDRLAGEVQNGFKGVAGRLNSIDSRFNRLERKLDQFIDTQSKANVLVERRLTTLEPPSGSDSR